MERTGGGGSSMVIKAPPKKKEEEKQTEQEDESRIIRFTVKPRNNVKWEVGTIDNEEMGKRKSKVCCIYNKPHTLDTSSSSSDCGSHDSHHEKNRYDRLPKHQRIAMRKMAKEKEDAMKEGPLGEIKEDS